MSPAEIKDTQAKLDKILQANASRPVGTRPFAIDTSRCNHPGNCTKCGKR